MALNYVSTKSSLWAAFLCKGLTRNVFLRLQLVVHIINKERTCYPIMKIKNDIIRIM